MYGAQHTIVSDVDDVVDDVVVVVIWLCIDVGWVWALVTLDKYVWSAARDCTIRKWDIKNGSCVKVIQLNAHAKIIRYDWWWWML